MKNTFKVALLQIMPCSSTEENLRKGIEYCIKAKEKGADVALFPEMWSCGYTIPEDKDVLNSLAVDENGSFVREFGVLAKSLDMAIAVTYLKSTDTKPMNAVTLFDRNGKKCFTYCKVHTCDFGDEARLGQGEDFYTAELDTASGKVNVGAMICYDREFPESARILMLKGAEIILVPNACPMEINRISQLRGRAYENMLGIATCNYPSGKPDCNGHSNAFDGVAYRDDLPGSRDTKILEADGTEGIFMAEFDMDMIRDYRKNEVHGNAYRRPWKYTLLIDEDKKAPFIRDDFNK